MAHTGRWAQEFAPNYKWDGSDWLIYAVEPLGSGWSGPVHLTPLTKAVKNRSG